MLTDPIADMLTRIRNAARAGHDEVECSTSRLRLAVAKVLSDEGFVGEVTTSQEGSHPSMKIRLRYDDGGRMMIDHVKRVSRPGRRVYVSAGQVPKVRNGLRRTDASLAFLER